MSAYSKSPCSVPGCHQFVPRWRLMCDAHWRLVPARHRARVTDIGKCLRLEMPQTRATREAYEAACRDALRAVVDLTTPPGARR